ncbi:SCP-like protein [Oesophagostomum dentatum]|uniref:SCP-like protein n=1 Tax=Oesophagostomum dentatum TaxID=61180 RepID=A0A0B1TRM6_OESDE|nr:SCP-like protein [Oesophagostomum dentatum]
MTDSVRTAVLDKHNALRSALALGTVTNGKTGKLCRKASKMPRLTYNCDLEKSAYERAELCSSLSSVAVPDGVSENSLNFTTRLDKRTPEKAGEAAANMWWSELSLLEDGLEQIQNLYYTHQGINSFAKIASDLTTQVGCAVKRCTDSINVVCHYNTTLTNAVKLYTCGPSCRKCPEDKGYCYIGMCSAP